MRLAGGFNARIDIHSRRRYYRCRLTGQVAKKADRSRRFLPRKTSFPCILLLGDDRQRRVISRRALSW
jgi:hypothetical protein